jgi:hypothetical protein
LQRGSLGGGILNDELAGSLKGSNLIGIEYQIRPLLLHDGIWSESEAGIALGMYIVSEWDPHSLRLTNFSVCDRAKRPMQLEGNVLGWTLNGLWIAFKSITGSLGLAVCGYPSILLDGTTSAFRQTSTATTP